MSRSTFVMAAALLALSVGGCSFHARDPESYRKVTREVLETKSADIKTCYDKALEADPKAGGTVVISFVVEKDTGVIKNVNVNQNDSTAPKDLTKCVAGALEGLKIDPPDAREGQATFTWELQAKS